MGRPDRGAGRVCGFHLKVNESFGLRHRVLSGLHCFVLSDNKPFCQGENTGLCERVCRSYNSDKTVYWSLEGKLVLCI